MNRHEATRRVMHSIMRPDSAVKLRYVAADGSRPVVVCTPGEYLSDVTKRIDAVGGSANVIMAEVRRFKVMVIEAVPDGVEADSEGVNAELSMGMFYLRANSKARRTGTFHIGGVNVDSATQAFEYA
ncbi:MAG TPA: hypothetical protein VN041_13935 [Microbacterium sp.]|nr:hypothetical protein [Microbacterium sp.]